MRVPPESGSFDLRGVGDRLLPEAVVRKIIRRNRDNLDQFSDGLSKWSITSIFTGPLADSSLRPNCS